MSASDLSIEQLKHFDLEFRDWTEYRTLLDELLSKPRQSTLLDIGGGNGQFLDHVLEEFPNCEGILLDNSDYMLSRNKTHARKRLTRGSALEVHKVVSPGSCDLITVNVLLHHLVGSTYSAATAATIAALNNASRVLTANGRIVVYEQVYDGLVPWLEPGVMIFKLTSLRAPLLTPMLRRLGANTAGVGVAFRSARAWTRVFKAAGLRVIEHRAVHQDSPPVVRRAALLLRSVGTQLFVLAR
jgi:SAM-dependent methyltransferase